MAATRNKAATTKKKSPAKKPVAATKPAPAKKPAAKPPLATKPLPPPPPPPAPLAPPPAPPPVDHAARVAEAWQRLEAFVASIGAPPLALEPPATKKSIAEAEKTMGLAFPPDFRASLLLHDGQAEGRSFPWMPGCPPLVPVARIVEAWKKLQKPVAAKKGKPEIIEPTARVKPGLVRPGRIPIADGTFLDLDPGPAGTSGQLLATVNGIVAVVDTSFGAALERWVSVLERGLWAYDPDKHRVLPRAAPLFEGNPAGLFAKR